MLLKVIGAGGKGRGGCGHMIRRSEPYFIISENGVLTAACQNCVKQRYGKIPKAKEMKTSDLIRFSG